MRYLGKTADDEAEAQAELRQDRARRLRRWILLGILVFCWCSGLIGRGIATGLSLAAPFDMGDGLRINYLQFRTRPAVPARGVVVGMNKDRLDEMIDDALGWRRLFLPPGLIRGKMYLKGLWRPDEVSLPGDGLPVLIAVDDGFGYVPTLWCRYPSSRFNDLLSDDTLLASSRTKEWMFGHYDLLNKKTFETLSLRTDPLRIGDPIDQRRIECLATGKIRYTFDDTIIGARSTADMRKLVIEVIFKFARSKRGIRISHVATITELDADFGNMAPMLDKSLSEKIRHSMEKSLNKEKNRKRIGSLCVPHWFPLDSMVDIQLTE
jgi:hypothetical protein